LGFNLLAGDGPYVRDPNVTNVVASRGVNVIGFAQLVRHSETDTVRVEYWLFSLTVLALYRGLGIGEALTRHVAELALAGCRGAVADGE